MQLSLVQHDWLHMRSNAMINFLLYRIFHETHK